MAVTDVNADGARAVAAELDGTSHELDVRSAESVRDGVRAAASDLGRIDILVNCAGYAVDLFLTKTDQSVWDPLLEINLRGTIAVTHAVLPGMQERGSGRIVNVASEAGRVGSPGSPVYSAAKGGVIAFTKTIARESARFGVACNAVAPGPIDTPMLDAAPKAMGELGERYVKAMIESTAMKRLGQPEEVAAAIAFLASDEASYITGETLGVSGGLGMM